MQFFFSSKIINSIHFLIDKIVSNVIFQDMLAFTVTTDEKLSCTLTPRSMSMLNCETYQRRTVFRVADTELVIDYLNPTTRFNSWCRMSSAQPNKQKRYGAKNFAQYGRKMWSFQVFCQNINFLPSFLVK